MIVIAIFVSFAVMGYLITPDNTPFSNKQILEINNQRPGFKVEMIKVRRNESIEIKNIISRMFNGQRNTFNEIPISNYEIIGSNIVYSLFGENANDALNFEENKCR